MNGRLLVVVGVVVTIVVVVEVGCVELVVVGAVVAVVIVVAVVVVVVVVFLQFCGLYVWQEDDASVKPGRASISTNSRAPSSAVLFMLSSRCVVFSAGRLIPAIGGRLTADLAGDAT